MREALTRLQRTVASVPASWASAGSGDDPRRRAPPRSEIGILTIARAMRMSTRSNRSMIYRRLCRRTMLQQNYDLRSDNDRRSGGNDSRECKCHGRTHRTSPPQEASAKRRFAVQPCAPIR